MINEKCPICNKGKIVLDDITDITDLDLEKNCLQIRIDCHCDNCQEIYFATIDYSITETYYNINDHFNAIN